MLSPDLARHEGKYYGKYSGTVTDNEDSEKRGRVKVRVPTVFGPELEVWARPCFPFGHFYVPDNETQVWVEFETGNPDFPLWVGTWYAEGKAPAEAAIAPPTNRVIQTPSGHTIEISDEGGEEKITIKHNGDSFVAIDKEGSVIISNQKGSHLYLNAKDGAANLIEEHGNLLSMSKDGAMLVNADGTLVELKGDTARILGKNVVLQGSSVALGEGAAEPTLLGQTFATMWNLFAAHTHATGVGPSGPPLPPPSPLGPGMGLTSAVVVK